MNIKFLRSALFLALSASALGASAQKNYTEGFATYTIQTPGGAVDTKSYFKGDSSLTSMQQGPADIKIITAKNGDYLAVLVDVPVASIKKAAIATPAEIEEGKAQEPKFTFTPGTETKVISGFNCKKVTVKDSKSGSSYEAWVTNDIKIPATSFSHTFKEIGGVPVQFTALQQGQAVNVTLKSVTDQKVAAGFFGIPKDFEKITLTDLKSLGGGGN
ncbi:hypothetical protein [Mucilaginibacter defluvii]|uniref:DUF4412 domain-containing protein n=1 Tax=Mucilaginibacter defluvii TaxID=1196019 RepID=A0ABP9FX46_9SPHI